MKSFNGGNTMRYYNEYERDLAWNEFKRLVEGGSLVDKNEEKWKEMAKRSSRKELMLQKQRNLRAKMRAL